MSIDLQIRCVDCGAPREPGRLAGWSCYFARNWSVVARCPPCAVSHKEVPPSVPVVEQVRRIVERSGERS